MKIYPLIDHLKDNIDNIEIDSNKIIDEIISSNKIFIAGVGRSGLVGKMFAIRLMHLDKSVYIVGDLTTPKISKSDLLIAISGSGETSTVVSNVKVAKDVGAKIIAFTAKKNSLLASLSHEKVYFNTKSKYEIQNNQLLPLGSAFELLTLLTFESLISELIKKMGINEDFLKERHTNLE